jgi:hypothetical protein
MDIGNWKIELIHFLFSTFYYYFLFSIRLFSTPQNESVSE